MKCRHCKSEKTRKHCKWGDRQRYFCNDCKRTFSEHRITYTKAEKRLLSFLINFLENDLKDIDIKEFFKKSKTYESGISDIVIETARKNDVHDSMSALHVFCKRPRLIICEHDNKIKLVKIPEDVSKKCKGSFNLYWG